MGANELVACKTHMRTRVRKRFPLIGDDREDDRIVAGNYPRNNGHRIAQTSMRMSRDDASRVHLFGVKLLDVAGNWRIAFGRLAS